MAGIISTSNKAKKIALSNAFVLNLIIIIWYYMRRRERFRGEYPLIFQLKI